MRLVLMFGPELHKQRCQGPATTWKLLQCLGLGPRRWILRCFKLLPAGLASVTCMAGTAAALHGALSRSWPLPSRADGVAGPPDSRYARSSGAAATARLLRCDGARRHCQDAQSTAQSTAQSMKKIIL